MQANAYEPKTRHVEVSADDEGNFTISPTTCVAHPNDHIIWKAPARKSGDPDNPFIIHFYARSPLHHVTTVRDGGDRDGEVVGDVPNGVYEYAVGIYDPESKRVAIHVSGEVEVRRRFP